MKREQHSQELLRGSKQEKPAWSYTKIKEALQLIEDHKNDNFRPLRWLGIILEFQKKQQVSNDARKWLLFWIFTLTLAIYKVTYIIMANIYWELANILSSVDIRPEAETR